MNPDEMSVTQAAEALDLNPWTVRNRCRLGILAARRKRHGWVIPRAMVEAMVKENAQLLGDGIPNAAMLEYEKEQIK